MIWHHSGTATESYGPWEPLASDRENKRVCLQWKTSMTFRLSQSASVWGKRKRVVNHLDILSSASGVYRMPNSPSWKHHGLVVQMFEVALPHPLYVRAPG